MASITKVQGGRYRLRYRDPNGGSRTETFDRKVDAERRMAIVEASKIQGDYVDRSAGRVTVKDYAEKWQATRVHRESSAERLDVYLRVHVIPHLGSRPIGQVRHSEIQGWVKKLSETLAPGTVENVFRAVSGMMRSAVRDRVIAVNPAEDIVLPRRPKTEIVPPTIEQVSTLLEAMPERYRILGILAAGAGLRQGEALGLSVDRVDFLRRTLRVDRQLVTKVREEASWGPPKTEASVRTVPLADSVLNALSAHLAAFPPGPDGLVCTYHDGRPIKRNRFGAMWRQSTARAGLEQFRFHDLRHHFASVLIAGGCSIKAVQHALGHASAKETLDTYAHLWPDSDELTRSAVEASFAAAASRACHDLAATGTDNALTSDGASTEGRTASSAASNPPSA